MGVERDAEVAERAGAVIVVATLHVQTPVVSAALPAAIVEIALVVTQTVQVARRAAASVTTAVYFAVAAEHRVAVRRTLDHLGRVRRASTRRHRVAESLGKRVGAALEETECDDGLAGGACVRRDVIAVAHESGGGCLDCPTEGADDTEDEGEPCSAVHRRYVVLEGDKSWFCVQHYHQL